MCGIAGVIDSRGPVDPALIDRMCAAMEHRGPDARGVHLADGAGLGAQRLAIIDRVHGAQPVLSESGEVAAVLNGEIYNHRELQTELLGRGHRFRSAVDTEVLVHLYEEEGAELVHRLRGMFAFAIWDGPRRRLLCARDRAGKKPLFWSEHGGRLTFASELGALLEDPAIPRRTHAAAIEAYLGLGYVPDPLCAVQGVHKLPPASTLVREADGAVRVERYWRLAYGPKRTAASPREFRDEVRTRLDAAVAVRLESDVPVGAFLSGGIDSSAVVASMAPRVKGPLRTYSVGFEDPAYDESPFARLVAERFGTEHTELRVGPDTLDAMPRLAHQYGEPFGDSSAIPTFALAELASRDVTVVLTGDGGDESFGGYERYVPSPRLERIARVPGTAGTVGAAVLRLAGRGSGSRSARRRLGRLAHLVALDDAGRYANALLVFGPAERAALLSPGFGSEASAIPPEHRLAGAWGAPGAEAPVDRMMAVDVATYLPGDLLPKVDIATMAHSVEARSPFLDHELMEFAATLPAGLKLDGGEGKAILRAALRGVVPDAVLDRPKRGFAVPLARWLREERPGLAGELLLDPGAATGEYLERSAVEELVREHDARVADHSRRLWVLMMLELWHREVLNPQATGP